ncbi:unnamed protein product [Prunus brigantina]
MSNNESRYDSEPNTFDRGSLDDRQGNSSEALSFVGDRVGFVPTHCRRKGLITAQPVPLVTVPYSAQSPSASQYCEFLMRDTRAPEHHASYQLETSTSGGGDVVAESSPRLVVTIVHRGNPRIPLGNPKDGEVVFFTDMLQPIWVTDMLLSMATSLGPYRLPRSCGGIGGSFCQASSTSYKFDVDRIYPGFLFIKNLVKEQLVDLAESKCLADDVGLFGNNLLSY